MKHARPGLWEGLDWQTMASNRFLLDGKEVCTASDLHSLGMSAEWILEKGHGKNTGSWCGAGRGEDDSGEGSC